jgi:hypothetical protein
MPNADMLFWKTAENPAYVPTFADVEDKVRKRWQLEKARELAQKEAEAIAKEAAGAGGDPERVLKDKAKRFGTQVIALDNVSRLKAPKQQVAVPSMTPQALPPYQVPEDKIEYPHPEMVEKLLTLDQKGEVVIVQEQPQQTYYVAALVDGPTAPSLGQLADIYRSGSVALRQVAQDDHTRREYRDTLIAELRRQAGLEVNQEIVKSLTRQGSADAPTE